MRPLKIGIPTRMTTDAVLVPYFREMVRHAPLSPGKEVQLAVRIQQGDQAARDQLVRANLRFVVSVAKRYTGLGLPLCDLISEGNVGLILAAERFDPDRGFKFISYAVWLIRKSILKALQDTGTTIRVPEKQARLRDRWMRAQRDAAASFGSGCSEQVSAPEPAHLAALLHVSGPMLGLDDVLTAEGSPLHERVASTEEASDASAQRASVKRTTEHMLQRLPPRHREVLQQYYGIGGRETHTLQDIGLQLHCTSERVRQIKARALVLLRHQSHCTISPEDLP